MPYIKDGPPRTVHIQFAPEEINRLTRKADAVGLKLPAYVRQMSLTGKVKGYNLKPLLEHSVAVGEVAAAVRDMVAKEHPDRWAYEADLERMDDMVRQLIESERTLIADMTRRLKR